jgi:glyoxylase-like metal-dependent hydrolase (beta-lactamase superfamily II)
MFGIAPGRYCSVSNVDLEMNDGDILQIGEISAKILHTPGHSPGHIVLFIDTESEQVLLAGDTLFAGSVGRTDLPGGSHEALISSIKGKLFGLPDHTRVLPGHGPETTIGNEKKRNPYLQ